MNRKTDFFTARAAAAFTADARELAYYAGIEAAIDKYGWLVQGVAANPAFVYTIGLHRRDLPELLFIGNMHPDLMKHLLNTVGLQISAEGEPAPGVLEIGWTMPAKIRECGARAKADYTVQAGQFHGTEDYRVLQVLVPDKQGRFAGERGCAPALDVDMP